MQTVSGPLRHSVRARSARNCIALTWARCLLEKASLDNDLHQNVRPHRLNGQVLSVRAFCAPPHRRNAESVAIQKSEQSVPGPVERRSVSNWNAANYVTCVRLALAPAAGALILSGQNSSALVVVLVAGVSDALDGYLARRFALQTALGEVLDPLADKLLVACTAGALCAQGALPPWIVALVVARDAALVIGSAFLPAAKRVTPTTVSKVNTALQITLCVAATASAGDLAFVDPAVVHGLAVATAATTSASGLSYASRFWKNL